MIAHEPVLPIVTERLLLRRFLVDDFAAYAGYRTRRDVYRYLYALPPDEERLLQRFTANLDAPFAGEGDSFRLAVCLLVIRHGIRTPHMG